jgi:hypothetical protein
LRVGAVSAATAHFLGAADATSLIDPLPGGVILQLELDELLLAVAFLDRKARADLGIPATKRVVSPRFLTR